MLEYMERRTIAVSRPDGTVRITTTDYIKEHGIFRVVVTEDVILRTGPGPSKIWLKAPAVVRSRCALRCDPK
jgi:hypothetical protein